jgi:hypothetical protein
VLARLNEVSGVEGSFANQSGTLIRLSLRPGADPKRVAVEASRVLREQTGDRVGVRLEEGATAAALQREDWRDEGRVAESISAGTPTDPARAVEPRPPERHGLLIVFFGCAAVGLWLLWRRICKGGGGLNLAACAAVGLWLLWRQYRKVAATGEMRGQPKTLLG